MFLSGYYILCNQQLFENVPPEKTFNNLPGNPKHKFIDTKAGLNLGILAYSILNFWILRVFCERINARDDDDIRKDSFFEENLPSFWKSIDGTYQKVWYAQEIYNKDQFGFN